MKPTIDAISPEQLQAWKRLADEATPEWYVDEDRPLCIRSRLKNQMRKDAYVAKVEFLGPPFDDEEHRKNAAFIAAARTAVPALIAQDKALALIRGNKNG